MSCNVNKYDLRKITNLFNWYKVPIKQAERFIKDFKIESACNEGTVIYYLTDVINNLKYAAAYGEETVEFLSIDNQLLYDVRLNSLKDIIVYDGYVLIVYTESSYIDFIKISKFMNPVKLEQLKMRIMI